MGRHYTTSQPSEKDEISPLQRIILGSGRSGTTWVLDCLAQANGLRPVFEPLHQNESAVGSDFAYDVLTSGDSATRLEHYLEDIVSGRTHSRWIDYRAPRGLFSPRPRHFKSVDSTMRWLSDWRKYLRRRQQLRESVNRQECLIKCIRGNLMAGWFAGQLSFRTALIVRHPCAVVESQLRLGKTWDPSSVRRRYRDNSRLDALTNGRYRQLLMGDLSTIESLTLNWVIENQWPIERSADAGYSVHYYEDLVGGAESSWRRLCESLDLNRIPDAELLRRPSQQADVNSTPEATDFSVPGWKKRMSEKDLAKVQGILDSTNFMIYRADIAGPVHGKQATTRRRDDLATDIEP